MEKNIIKGKIKYNNNERFDSVENLSEVSDIIITKNVIKNKKFLNILKLMLFFERTNSIQHIIASTGI